MTDPQASSGPVLFNLSTGFIGFEAAVAFNDFCQNYSKIVTVDDVLNQGKLDLTSEFTIAEHCALIEKMDAEDIFAEVVTEEQASNLVGYFVSLPSEAAMKLWTLLGKEGNNTENVVRLHQGEYEGVSASSYLVELLTGNDVS